MWLKRAHRGPMDAVGEAHAVAGQGLDGNAENSKTRQVTLIEREVWDTLMSETDSNVSPAARRANLMISGVSLAHSRNRILRVGPVRPEIAGETKPCEQMEAVTRGLEQAMRDDWKGGAYARVLDDGVIRTGDRVSWETDPEPDAGRRVE